MDKRTHIVRSAQLLFSQFGLKKVTTDDIAREASVSKATIYKHFRNKEEIFNTVLENETDQLLLAIREAVAEESDPVNRLRAHLHTRLDKVKDFTNFYRVTQATWGDYWPHIAQVRKRFLRGEKDIVREILQTGVYSGTFHIEQLDSAAHVLVVALASVEHQWSLEEQELSLPALVDMMIDMMVNGIRRK